MSELLENEVLRSSNYVKGTWQYEIEKRCLAEPDTILNNLVELSEQRYFNYEIKTIFGSSDLLADNTLDFLTFHKKALDEKVKEVNIDASLTDTQAKNKVESFLKKQLSDYDFSLPLLTIGSLPVKYKSKLKKDLSEALQIRLGSLPKKLDKDLEYIKTYWEPGLNEEMKINEDTNRDILTIVVSIKGYFYIYSENYIYFLHKDYVSYAYEEEGPDQRIRSLPRNPVDTEDPKIISFIDYD